MKKLFLAAAVVFTSALCPLTSYMAWAQDYRFSQYYANPLRLNPAMMGANSDMKFILGYRSQWSAIQKGFTTMSFTGMYPLFMKSGGKLDIGLSAINDKAGAFNTMDAALSIDYNKEIAADNNLCLALLGGYVQKSLDAANLTFDSQYVLGSYTSSNPSNEQVVNEKVSYPDVGFGLTWYMNPSRDKSKLNAFAGVAGFHLNQPNQSLTGADGKLPVRFSYIGGIKIFGPSKIDLSPNIRVTQQKGNVETAAGVNVDYNLSDNMKLVLGTWFRRNDAIAFMIGIEHKVFTFGYSYDAVTSSLSANALSVTAHEITLSYKMKMKPKSASPQLDAGGGKSSGGGKTNPFNTF